MIRVIARMLWVAPLFLVFLSANQAKVAYDLRATWLGGIEGTAEVLEWTRTSRADVTYGYVSLRVPLTDGSMMVKRRMSLPYTLLPRLEGEDSLSVHIQKGASQEVVIDRLMPAHWLIAAAQAGISLAGAAMLFLGVFWWNAFLRRSGDPAHVR